MKEANNIYHAIYLLERALSDKGFKPTIVGKSFVCSNSQAKFVLTFLPGNRRVLVSHGVEILSEFRGKGLGRELLRLRESCAIKAGVNLLMATVRNDNAPEIHLLETDGWSKVSDRRETGVALWIKQLK